MSTGNNGHHRLLVNREAKRLRHLVGKELGTMIASVQVRRFSARTGIPRRRLRGILNGQTRGHWHELVDLCEAIGIHLSIVVRPLLTDDKPFPDIPFETVVLNATCRFVEDLVATGHLRPQSA